jgi:hypothetical protein
MKTFTLDTNCIVALDDETRAERKAVIAIIEAGKEGRIDVAVVASSAAEKQLTGAFLGNIADFKERMDKLGLEHVELLKPIATYGMTFFDHAIYPTKEHLELQTRIFETLFPGTPAIWSKHAADLGQSPEDTDTPDGMKWRNKFLDAQAMWGHINYGRDIFVTSDANFARRFKASEQFKDVVVVTPSEAVDMLATT